MTSLISALMTVYNGENFIRETIDSILNQTFSNFELIIVDDASTDNTVNIVKGFLDTRIKLIELKENLGVGGAIIEGLKYVNGEYVAKVDSDDIYEKNRFELQLNYLLDNPKVSLVGGIGICFPNDEEVEKSSRYQFLKKYSFKFSNNIIEPKDIQEKMYDFPCIIHSTIMYRANLLTEITYNPSYRIAEDYDFLYRLNRTGYILHKIPFKVANIRISENSTTVIENSTVYNIFLDIKKDIWSNKENRKIYIWGTGNLGEIVANYLENKGINFKGFIDSDEKKIGLLKKNKEIYHKDVLDEKCFIFVASSYGKFEIAQDLEMKNLRHLENYLIVS